MWEDKGKKRRSPSIGGREVQCIFLAQPEKTGAGPFQINVSLAQLDRATAF
jgi:hypothetical protein